MNTLQSSLSPVRQTSDSMSVKASTGQCACIVRFDALCSNLQERSDYEFVSLCDYLPETSRERYDYMKALERNGLPYPIMLLTHSSGNNIGNLHIVWKLPISHSCHAP